jgi:hypothetical protein
MRLVSQRDIPVGLFLLSPIPVRILVKFRDALAKQLSRAVVIRNFRLASRLVISEGCLRVIPGESLITSSTRLCRSVVW